MTKHLYFFVSLKDALLLSQKLSLLGITRYHVRPHDQQIAFVFEHVTDMRHALLRRIFGADGLSQPDD